MRSVMQSFLPCIIALWCLDPARALPAPRFQFQPLQQHNMKQLRGGSPALEMRNPSTEETAEIVMLHGLKRVPRTMELLSFMMPTFGVYLANPILSLVDTAVVGQFCDATELASLGPGCSLCDMTVFMFNFLALATTTLLVAARRQVAVGFSISIGTGILMSLGLYIFGEALVGVFAGSGGEAAKATLSRSLSYVRIRGAGSVPTLIMMVAQAACIGAKDAESPLIAICIVSVFNCFLDWLFVGPFRAGAAGAAWATSIAQTAGAVYLYFCVSNTLDRLDAGQPGTGEASRTQSAEKRTGGSLFVMPTPAEARSFLQFAGPMFIVSMARTVSWNLTTPAAAAAGTLALAAHQVVLNVFFFFTIAGAAVFQTTQAYMPEFHQRQTEARMRVSAQPEGSVARSTSMELLQEADKRVQKLAKKLLLIATMIGLGQVGVSLLPLLVFPQVFTNDRAVQALVRRLSGWASFGIFPHCLTFSIEALLLNSKDVTFLANFHVFILIGWAASLRWQVARWPGIDQMWVCMCALQYVRFSVWLARLVFSGKKLGLHQYSLMKRRQKGPVRRLAARLKKALYGRRVETPC